MPLGKIFISILTFVMLLGGVLTTWGAEALTVAEVRVEGNRRVEKSAITPLISVQPGQPFTAGDVDRDILAVYKLGRFEDVRADIETENGIRVLIYRLEERPLVRSVEYGGNKEIETSKLREVVTLKSPDIFEPRVVAESIKKMKEVYVAEGYHAATIKEKLTVNDANEATVTFEIEEGEKALVGTIAFEGNTVFDDDDLREAMETRERWFLSWLTGRGAYLPDVLENDLAILADMYFNKGYLQVKVKEPTVTVSDDKKSLLINIRIEEGDQFSIGRVDIEGELIRSQDELISMMQLKPGDIFSRQILRQDLAAMNNLYADAGFAYVNISPLTRLDTENRLVDLRLAIEQGIRVRIGRININGNTRTRDKVIRREVNIEEGDLYNASRLKSSRRRINNLGFFEEVEVVTNKTAVEDVLDIDITVKEKPTGTFSLGAGYSSVDGVIAQGAVSQNNLFGYGLKLDFSAAIGGATTYNIGLLDPYFLDYKVSLGFDLYKSTREYVDFDKKTTGGDVKFGFDAGEDNKLFFTYRYEEKEIYDVDSTASYLIREQEGKSSLSSISGTFTRNTTDNYLDPNDGYVARLSTEYAGLGGTEKFAKVILDHRHFFPFIGPSVLSLHGQLGQIFEVQGEETPIDERFYLGGISTLRGLPARKVGPRVRRVVETVDPVTGATVATSENEYNYIGGDKEAFGNVEVIFPLFPEVKLKGVVFFDVGNAWGSDQEFFEDVRTSTGAGIRWLSPMGPMRLEWGYNLDPRSGEDNSEFEFTIGRFF